MKRLSASILSGFGKMLPQQLASLRARLILGNILITFIAVLAMGYYVYYRVQESTALLANQLEDNVRNRAEDELSVTTREQAALLDNFFASMRDNISTLGTTEGRMLSEERLLNSGVYWDASTSLFRLDSGSWDNSNTEVASVFIPSTVTLANPLLSKLNVLKQTELIVPSIIDNNPDIIAIYFGGVSKETIYFPNIDLAAIVPPNFDVTSRPWFVDAAPKENPQGEVVWSTPYQDAALNGLVITASTPVLDEQGKFQGVAAMDIQLTRITNIISKISIGETGYAFLVDKDNRLIALPPAGYNDFGFTAETVPFGEILDLAKLDNTAPGLVDILKSFSSNGSQLSTVQLGGEERFVIYQNIPAMNYNLAIIVPTQELLTESAAIRVQIAQETRNTIMVSILLVALILVIASFAALGIANRLTTPLKSLTSVANEIIRGNFDARAEVQNRDELGTLAETLNIMTTNFKNLVRSLEERVTERTVELKGELVKGELRGKQFEAIAKVSQTINATQNLQELLPTIADVVSGYFGFYHVGIFMNDAGNQYAVLGAANSAGGKKMLERGHQLKIGEQGIVGYVTSTGNPRIALDVGEDVVFFNNPDLPETHSEMALPLKISGTIIGALDVQSTEPNAFSKEDVEVLSTLADQISLAIENARLFDQTKKMLVEAEAIQRLYVRETWGRLPMEEKLNGYRYSIAGAVALDEGAGFVESDEDTHRQETSVPIILRGETIGTLSVQVPKNEHISSDQSDLIRAVAERVALSAENARLFNETQKRATQLESLNEMGRVISQQIELKPVLKAAYDQLKRVIQLDSFIVVMFDEESVTTRFALVLDEDIDYTDDSSEPLNPNSTTGQVILTGQPVLRLLTEKEYSSNPEPIGMVGDTSKISASLIYVPLNLGQKTIGALSIQSYRLNAYAQDHLSLVQNIANQLSIGIQNASLFEEATRRAERERVISDISAKIGTSVRTESILQTTARELSQILNGADILIKLGIQANGNGTEETK